MSDVQAELWDNGSLSLREYKYKKVAKQAQAIGHFLCKLSMAKMLNNGGENRPIDCIWS